MCAFVLLLMWMRRKQLDEPDKTRGVLTSLKLMCASRFLPCPR